MAVGYYNLINVFEILKATGKSDKKDLEGEDSRSDYKCAEQYFLNLLKRTGMLNFWTAHKLTSYRN